MAFDGTTIFAFIVVELLAHAVLVGTFGAFDFRSM